MIDVEIHAEHCRVEDKMTKLFFIKWPLYSISRSRAQRIGRTTSEPFPFAWPQVKRLSMVAVSTEASLTEAHAKVEYLSRQLEGAQQQLDASEGLERDLQRLGREAEEMHRKADQSLEEKQVGVDACNDTI